ncbi:hypothetical protein EMPS_09293 [Entomortierella parvispora]|uniref:Uncharacterized protein n=1 Tax=Entomortierella parvispora TaxID=205924 RepID=A0A9P3HHP8_9FUNG|nr:hypothetical protein EMPS_09293 [Entomortierella parvispora]
MSFIFNYFYFDSSATESEKENAAALRLMFKERKDYIKSESKKYEIEYKQALHEADLEYKRAKDQAREDFQRKIQTTLNTEFDTIMATDEYANADAKTRSKLEGMRNWMNGWMSSGCTVANTKAKVAEEETVEVTEIYYPDEKKTPLVVV